MYHDGHRAAIEPSSAPAADPIITIAEMAWTPATARWNPARRSARLRAAARAARSRQSRASGSQGLSGRSFMPTGTGNEQGPAACSTRDAAVKKPSWNPAPRPLHDQPTLMRPAGIGGKEESGPVGSSCDNAARLGPTPTPRTGGDPSERKPHPGDNPFQSAAHGVRDRTRRRWILQARLEQAAVAGSATAGCATHAGDERLLRCRGSRSGLG